MAAAAKVVASRTPFHGLTGTGGRKRRGPMGGSAKGTPRKTRMAGSEPAAGTVSPRSLPEGVVTIAGSPGVLAAKRADGVRASAARVALLCWRKRRREELVGVELPRVWLIFASVLFDGSLSGGVPPPPCFG